MASHETDRPETPREEFASWAEVANLQARLEALERTVDRLQGSDMRAPEPVEISRQLPYPANGLQPPPPPASAPAILSPATTAQSLEDRLGSQVFSRVGIVALLAGTAWFLKWAIDNQWIGPLGRVLVGLTAGAALILWSERFRRNGTPAFSYALKAVGSGILYLSLWAAFQLYHLLPASVALAAMLGVTAWNAWTAWAQDAELLAGYALLGGFATPALLSTGGNHEIFLFTYLAAIDLATVLLVRLKRWPRLLIPVFVATVGYFIGWYVLHFATTLATARDQLAVTLAYTVLFAAIFVFASLKATPATAASASSLILPVLLPLANAVFVALALYSVLEDTGNHASLPWVALALAAIYLGLTRLQRSASAIAVHLSLAIVFLTIAIPLKATGRWIALGWVFEGTALLWAAWRLSQSSKSSESALAFRFLGRLAVVALSLGFLDLFLLPQLILGFQGFLGMPRRLPAYPAEAAFFNQWFATALAGMAGFAVSAIVARRATADQPDPFWRNTGLIAGLAFNLVALEAGVSQILIYWQRGDGLAADLSISAFLMAYGGLLLGAGFWRRAAPLRWQALILLVCTIAKVFLYDIGGLSQGYRVASFLGLGALLLGVSFAYQKNLLGLRTDAAAPENQAHS